MERSTQNNLIRESICNISQIHESNYKMKNIGSIYDDQSLWQQQRGEPSHTNSKRH